MTPAEIQALHDAGTTQRQLAKILGVSTATISRHLKALGIRTRVKGGDWRRSHAKRTPEQIANAAANRAAGDRSQRARPVRREPCPHGVISNGKPHRCTLVGDGCDPVMCVGSRSAEGRVRVASSFGREAVMQGGMR